MAYLCSSHPPEKKMVHIINLSLSVIVYSSSEIEFNDQWPLFQTIYNSATVLGAHLLKCDLGQDL